MTYREYISQNPEIELVLQVSVLFGIAAVANFIIKKLLLKIIYAALSHTAFGNDKELRRHKLIPRLTHIFPAAIISSGIHSIQGLPSGVSTVISNVAGAFIILTIAMAIASLLAIVDVVYHRRPEARQKPIKGYIQVFKIAVFIVSAILIVATLFDKSPAILLSGLGAMAAVLILVFQDTLLSLVAGIQISSNDMIRVGDWIEMPAQNADGEVVEIALHTVKVQNWDKTITTIPIRRLVTDSFKNWRGMSETGARRIKRSIKIDQNTVRFLTLHDIESLRALESLGTYMDAKMKEIEASKTSRPSTLGGRKLTNIGTFRAYMRNYLQNHPRIRSDMTLIVRQMDPQHFGVPIEIYAFTNTTDWVEYEAIQSDIFDHILSVLPEFNLGVFQDVGGNDIARHAFKS
ncbi:mechanosensitive ion channel family protein [Celeribacter halophilus]|uniref:Miniconductance mechanosensitive channel n=1 Tax=Celeribacter halophilus TaxID=576117 RepID=A0A1I3X292_9RHOB|nr:mechanosensitive ion channel family protein [Celeribacter halophilus]PZX04681.1 miniconductance mechanosensitive channel [Celeribacter halophilus]SFK13912.1 miniconductance mechanosensitive channel [Celeribacter halophilus]